MRSRKLTAALIILFALTAVFPAAFSASGETGYDDSGMDYVSGSDNYAEYTFDDEYTEELGELADLVQGTNVRVRVVSVISDSSEPIDGGGYYIDSHVQTLLVKVLDGTFKGQELKVIYDLSDAWGGGNEPDPAKPGDMLIAQFSVGADGLINGVVTQYGRHPTMIWLGLIFVLLLFFFGGRRGIRSVVALAVTCVVLVAVMIPAILNGMNPVLASILACVFAVAVTLIIVYGFTKKTLAAGLGAIGGLAFAGIIVAIMNAAMNMTGLVDDESMYLAQSVGDGSIDLRGILFAAILIGVLGGTIDVSISIASALDELKQQAPGITGAEMMKSGVNIGVDIMGASLNTLILSYVGGSMHLLMLFYTYNNPLLMVINDEMIACEILRAMAGSYGLLLTVPLTSLVAAIMMCGGKFGHITADCFPSAVLVRRAVNGIKGAVTKLTDGAKNRAEAVKSTGSDDEPEIPDNLYEKAHRRSEAEWTEDDPEEDTTK